MDNQFLLQNDMETLFFNMLYKKLSCADNISDNIVIKFADLKMNKIILGTNNYKW